SVCEAQGPARTRDRSRTRICDSAPVMLSPVLTFTRHTGTVAGDDRPAMKGVRGHGAAHLCTVLLNKFTDGGELWKSCRPSRRVNGYLTRLWHKPLQTYCVHPARGQLNGCKCRWPMMARC